MKSYPLAFITVLILSAVPGQGAAVREMSHNEIRASVSSGQSLGLQRIMQIMAARVPGNIIDLRAYHSGGVYYRVLVKQADGRIASAVIDARTGRLLSSDTDIAQSVRAAAQAAVGSTSTFTTPSGVTPPAGAGNNNAGGNGNGNSGGNGNAGGNGNGNSGGNGNDDSGGRGNSGGNGNGNSGGNGNGKNK